MLGVIKWTIILYVVLKTCHVQIGPTSRRPDASLRTKLRSGEPWLAIGVLGCSALLTAYGSWFSRTSSRHWYAYSTNCYSKLTAAPQLPLTMRAAKFGSYHAAETVRLFFNQAETEGLNIGIPMTVTREKLDRDRIAYAEHYGRITSTGDRRAIAASFVDLDRCLRHVGTPPDSLFRP